MFVIQWTFIWVIKSLFSLCRPTGYTVWFKKTRPILYFQIMSTNIGHWSVRIIFGRQNLQRVSNVYIHGFKILTKQYQLSFNSIAAILPCALKIGPHTMKCLSIQCGNDGNDMLHPLLQQMFQMASLCMDTRRVIISVHWSVFSSTTLLYARRDHTQTLLRLFFQMFQKHAEWYSDIFSCKLFHLPIISFITFKLLQI